MPAQPPTPKPIDQIPLHTPKGKAETLCGNRFRMPPDLGWTMIPGRPLDKVVEAIIEDKPDYTCNLSINWEIWREKGTGVWYSKIELGGPDGQGDGEVWFVHTQK